MKLSRKTFLYSMGIAGLFIGLIVAYFVCMFPSLYVDYKNEQNLQSVLTVQKGYMKSKSYQGLQVDNPASIATLEIPVSGNELYLAGQPFKFKLEITDDEIKNVLQQVRDCLGKEDISEDDFKKIDWDVIKKKLSKDSVVKEELPVQITMEYQKSIREFEESATSKTHVESTTEGEIIVLENSVKDSQNEYTNYLAFGKAKDAYVVSALYVLTPQMREIKPILFGSLPMIVVVVFLITVLCSNYFSKKIVDPVIALADYAQQVEVDGNGELEPVPVTTKDEIGELSCKLNQMYEKLRENYRELEEKNTMLEKENKRQEVFLRASSHQLKTPVTAAMLLVDGMIQEVGKYKDTKTYLPQVKEQLKSMRKIIEDILYLNHSAENMKLEPVQLPVLTEQVLGAYRVQMEAKQLKVTVKLDKNESPSGEKEGVAGRTDRVAGSNAEAEILSDPELLKKMIDNLVSNAVAYTEKGGEILVEATCDTLFVKNKGAHIEEEMLPHIYEPFVSAQTISGNQTEKGKGLGLYVTAYYSELLGAEVKISNAEDGVLARLSMKKDFKQ